MNFLKILKGLNTQPKISYWKRRGFKLHFQVSSVNKRSQEVIITQKILYLQKGKKKEDQILQSPKK